MARSLQTVVLSEMFGVVMSSVSGHPTGLTSGFDTEKDQFIACWFHGVLEPVLCFQLPPVKAENIVAQHLKGAELDGVTGLDALLGDKWLLGDIGLPLFSISGISLHGHHWLLQKLYTLYVRRTCVSVSRLALVCHVGLHALGPRPCLNM
eukprot:4313064-Amphidinium_carterae.1